MSYPAPWDLTGSGYILIGHFSEDFVREYAQVSEPMMERFSGGFGALMLVDYASSNVGPYQEILFIPGRFKHLGKSYSHISQIRVSSQLSVDNGRINWGIPKSLAQFRFGEFNGIETVQVEEQGNEFARFQFRPLGWKLPFSLTWLPKTFRRLLQQDLSKGEGWLETLLSGRCKFQFMFVKSLEIDSPQFAPISKSDIHLAVKVSDFKLRFPVAKSL